MIEPIVPPHYHAVFRYSSLREDDIRQLIVEVVDEKFDKANTSETQMSWLRVTHDAVYRNDLRNITVQVRFPVTIPTGSIWNISGQSPTIETDTLIWRIENLSRYFTAELRLPRFLAEYTKLPEVRWEISSEEGRNLYSPVL